MTPTSSSQARGARRGRYAPGYTILVTDGEQRSALAVVRSLGRAGYRVFVGATQGRSLAGVSRHTTREIVMSDPLTEPDRFAQDVRAAVKLTGANIVVPISEASLLALLPERETLGAMIPFADIHTFRRVSHKGIVLETARTVGIAIPSQRAIASPDEAAELPVETLEYPLVVKPTRSVAGTGKRRDKFMVQHAATPEELRHVLGGFSEGAYPLLLQQRIIGPGVGIFVLIWNGEVIASFSHERIREKPPSGGVSVYRKSRPMDQALLDKSVALMRSFEWHGVAMIEYKLDEATGTPYLMEINGRFWGSLQLAVDAGVDFPRILIEAATGATPMPVHTYDTRVASRWLMGDFDHLLTRIRYTDKELNLPPGSPSRWATIRGMMTYHPYDHWEILRASDVMPAIVEAWGWLKQVFSRT